MDIKAILGRGILTTEFKDASYSYTGVRDFKEEKPEIIKTEPKVPQLKPRTRASQNNSYT